MKVFYCIFLAVLVSCSTKSNEKSIDEPSHLELTSFEKIFTDSASIFNGHQLGETLLEDIVLKGSLSKSDSFTSSIKIAENKINTIELEVHIENKEEAKALIAQIVTKYNKSLNYNKTASSFITWNYTTQKNLPVEIILIYEESLNTISLDISYKSQR